MSQDKCCCEISHTTAGIVWVGCLQLLGHLLPDTQFAEILPEAVSNHHLLPIRIKKRDGAQEILAKSGIETLIHYPVPIHLQECYKNLGFKRGDFPESEKLAREILSLPLYAELEDEEIKYICEKIKKL